MLWLVPLLLLLLATGLVLTVRMRRQERALLAQASEQLGRLHRRADALAQQLRRFDLPEPSGPGRDVEAGEAGTPSASPGVTAERPPVRRRSAAPPHDSEFASP